MLKKNDKFLEFMKLLENKRYYYLKCELIINIHFVLLNLSLRSLFIEAGVAFCSD